MKRMLISFLLLVGVVWHLVASTPPIMSAYLKNSRLQVACNTGEGIEMCFCFQPCMQNKLMTFSHVGVRAVDRATCDPLSLFRDSNMEWLNISTSDNIGPVGVKGYSNFVGGNHLWHRPSASGVPGKGEATEVRQFQDTGRRHAIGTNHSHRLPPSDGGGVEHAVRPAC